MFFGILGRIKPDLLEKVSLFASLYFLKFMGGIFDSVSDIWYVDAVLQSQFREYAPENHLEYIRMFLSAADEMGLPCFKILDLEQV